MRLLGIDPGSRHCGWGVVERQGSKVTALAWGRWSPRADLPLPARLAELARGLRDVLAAHSPERAAVERVFHGVSARSLIVLAEARGAILSELAGAGLEVAELTPAEVKSAVAGSGRADKQQVERMVRLQLGLADEGLSADAADALAVALAEALRAKFDRGSQTRS